MPPIVNIIGFKSFSYACPRRLCFFTHQEYVDIIAGSTAEEVDELWDEGHGFHVCNECNTQRVLKLIRVATYYTDDADAPAPMAPGWDRPKRRRRCSCKQAPPAGSSPTRPRRSLDVTPEKVRAPQDPSESV